VALFRNESRVVPLWAKRSTSWIGVSSDRFRELKISAPTLERTVVEKTLTHLVLDSLSPAQACLGCARGRLKFLSAG
jgi:hypothetical protein